MIGIIDYGIGNLRSVQKAFEHVGAQAAIVANPDQIAGIDKLVLPGVGAFADGMDHLRDYGWIEPIRAFVKAGKPFLGICLGMQLLFESSEEVNTDCSPIADIRDSSGGLAVDTAQDVALVKGLAILPGKVRRFRAAPGVRLKVPHMGWNTLSLTRPDPLMQGINTGDAVYFVHSYYAQPVESPGHEITSATVEYPAGHTICASIWRGNVWATQFHPEKSQTVGVRMLKNFVGL